MSNTQFVVTEAGDLTHCGEVVRWRDCTRHDEDTDSGWCAEPVCENCGYSEPDCDNQNQLTNEEMNAQVMEAEMANLRSEGNDYTDYNS